MNDKPIITFSAPPPRDTPRPWSPEARRTRDDLLLELSAVLLALCGGSLLLSILGYDMSAETIDWKTLLANGFADLGWGLLIVLLLTRRGGFVWNLPVSADEWGKEVGWGLLLLFMIMFCQFVIGFICRALGVELSPSYWASPLKNPATRAAFGLMVPLAALFEELCFRVYLQTRLIQLFGGRRVLTVALAACLFAAVHGYSWVGFFSVLALGAVLGTSYQMNGKIPRLVIAHVAYNLLVMLAGS